MTAPLLSLSGLSKRFGGLTAVDGVSFDMSAGDLVSIIGPNGAGKTTLFNLVTGQLSPTSGTVSFKGRDISRETPQMRARLGQDAPPVIGLVADQVLHGDAAAPRRRAEREAADGTDMLVELRGLRALAGPVPGIMDARGDLVDDDLLAVLALNQEEFDGEDADIAERFSDPDGRLRATFEIVWLSGWAPHESQQKPLRPGSAKARLADALGVPEIGAGDKAGGEKP